MSLPWIRAMFQPFSWMLLLAGAGLGLVLLAQPTLFEKTNRVVLSLLVLSGPCLLVLQDFLPCPKHRWSHHAQTALNLLGFSLLFWTAREATLFFVGFFSLMLFAMIGFAMNLLCTSKRNVFTEQCVVLEMKVWVMVAMLCWMFEGFVWLLYGMFALHYLHWRYILWHCGSTQLSQGQHKDIWCKHTDPFDAWDELYSYAKRYTDIASALQTLPLAMLLDILVQHKKHNPNNGGRRDKDYQPFLNALHTAIQNKNDTALLVLDMYGEHNLQAGVIALKSNAPAMPEQMELPAL